MTPTAEEVGAIIDVLERLPMENLWELAEGLSEDRLTMLDAVTASVMKKRIKAAGREDPET